MKRAAELALIVICLCGCDLLAGGGSAGPATTPGLPAKVSPDAPSKVAAKIASPDGGSSKAATPSSAQKVVLLPTECSDETPPFGSVHETSCQRIKGSGVISTTKTAGPAQSVTLRKGRAYVAVGEAGLQVYDIVAAGGPKLLGTLDTPGVAQWVDVDGDHAYVADGAAGLQVIDVSDPALATIRGALDTPGTAKQVQVARGHAFVADGSGGLRIIDVSSPPAPVEKASVETKGPAWAVQVRGDRAYLAAGEWDGRSQLKAIDVEDPASPRELGSTSVELARAMDVHRERVYVLSGDATLHVLDFREARAPDLVASVGLTNCGGCFEEGPFSIFANEGRVFLPGYYILDVSTPESPRFLARGPAGPASGFHVSGRRGYAAVGTEGLKVVSLNLGNLRLGRAVETRGSGVAVELAGKRLFVARGPSQLLSEGEDGLDVFDLGDDGTPRPVGSLELDAGVVDMALSGERAYLAVSPAEVRIIDVSEGQSPRQLSKLSVEGDAKGLAVSGHLLYLSFDGDEGPEGDRGQLAILDVSDPTKVRRLGAAPIRQDAGGVLVHCGLAYAGFGLDEDDEGSPTGGLAVVDVSHPASPSTVAEIDLGRNVMSMALRRPYLYVGLGSVERQEGDVQILDVSDPRSPRLVGSVRAGGAVTDIRLVQDTLFASVQPWGLLVADVARPEAPSRLGLVGPVSPDPADHYLDAGGVAIYGTKAYLASDRLHIVSLCSQ